MFFSHIEVLYVVVIFLPICSIIEVRHFSALTFKTLFDFKSFSDKSFIPPTDEGSTTDSTPVVTDDFPDTFQEIKFAPRTFLPTRVRNKTLFALRIHIFSEITFSVGQSGPFILASNIV